MSKRIPTGDSEPGEFRLAEGGDECPWGVGLLVLLRSPPAVPGSCLLRYSVSVLLETSGSGSLAHTVALIVVTRLRGFPAAG